MRICPACHSDRNVLHWAALGDRLFRTTASKFDLVRCLSCRTHFLSPVPKPHELPQYYPETYWVGPAESGEGRSVLGRLIERYRQWVLRDHVRFVRSAIQDQRSRAVTGFVLDVGCGDGSFLEALGEEGAIGLDLSFSAVRATRSRGLDAVQGTPMRCPLRPGSIAMITAFHFLEHVDDVDAILTSLRELLVPDGDLIVQVPNLDSWQARLLGRRWAGLDVPRHIVDFTHGGLLTALDRCGFEVVAENYHCLRDNPTTFVNSVAPGLYPPARPARGKAPAGIRALGANVAYLAATALAMPFALIESIFDRGASVMVRAVPRPR